MSKSVLPKEGSYHYRSKTETYNYVKKTGYLVKSPSAGKIGRWRKRWFMLVDLVEPGPLTGTPERQVRLEYYDVTVNKKMSPTELPNKKGMINLRNCVAVVAHDEKLKSYNYVINVIMSNFRVYHLVAKSEQERNDWIVAMNEFIFNKPMESQSYLTRQAKISQSVYEEFETSLAFQYSKDYLQSLNAIAENDHDTDPLISANRMKSISNLIPSTNIECDPIMEESLGRINRIPTLEKLLQVQLSNGNITMISRSNIVVGEVITNRNFTKTCHGIWQINSDIQQHVVIKSYTKNQMMITKEGLTLCQLMHPNIIKLLGAVLINTPKLLVIEFCERGTLKKVLKDHLRLLESGVTKTDELKITLLKYSRQVALGLNYLKNKEIVHGTLKAGNVLISNDDTCKISGFGESLKVMDKLYPLMDTSFKGPIQWTAPEAILRNDYSSASDVWSLGIVLYEIWSLGHEPYENLSIEEIIPSILKGLRLYPPPGVPKDIYRLMMDLWHPSPLKRPVTEFTVKYLVQPDSNILYTTQPPKSIAKQLPQLVTAAHTLGSDINSGEILHRDLQQAYAGFVNEGGMLMTKSVPTTLSDQKASRDYGDVSSPFYENIGNILPKALLTSQSKATKELEETPDIYGNDFDSNSTAGPSRLSKSISEVSSTQEASPVDYSSLDESDIYWNDPLLPPANLDGSKKRKRATMVLGYKTLLPQADTKTLSKFWNMSSSSEDETPTDSVVNRSDLKGGKFRSLNLSNLSSPCSLLKPDVCAAESRVGSRSRHKRKIPKVPVDELHHSKSSSGPISVPLLDKEKLSPGKEKLDPQKERLSPGKEKLDPQKERLNPRKEKLSPKKKMSSQKESLTLGKEKVSPIFDNVKDDFQSMSLGIKTTNCDTQDQKNAYYNASALLIFREHSQSPKKTLNDSFSSNSLESATNDIPLPAEDTEESQEIKPKPHYYNLDIVPPTESLLPDYAMPIVVKEGSPVDYGAGYYNTSAIEVFNSEMPLQVDGTIMDDGTGYYNASAIGVFGQNGSEIQLQPDSTLTIGGMEGRPVDDGTGYYNTSAIEVFGNNSSETLLQLDSTLTIAGKEEQPVNDSTGYYNMSAIDVLQSDGTMPIAGKEGRPVDDGTGYYNTSAIDVFGHDDLKNPAIDPESTILAHIYDNLKWEVLSASSDTAKCDQDISTTEDNFKSPAFGPEIDTSVHTYDNWKREELPPSCEKERIDQEVFFTGDNFKSPAVGPGIDTTVHTYDNWKWDELPLSYEKEKIDQEVYTADDNFKSPVISSETTHIYDNWEREEVPASFEKDENDQEKVTEAPKNEECIHKYYNLSGQASGINQVETLVHITPACNKSPKLGPKKPMPYIRASAIRNKKDNMDTKPITSSPSPSPSSTNNSSPSHSPTRINSPSPTCITSPSPQNRHSSSSKPKVKHLDDTFHEAKSVLSKSYDSFPKQIENIDRLPRQSESLFNSFSGSKNTGKSYSSRSNPKLKDQMQITRVSSNPLTTTRARTCSPPSREFSDMGIHESKLKPCCSSPYKSSTHGIKISPLARTGSKDMADVSTNNVLRVDIAPFQTTLTRTISAESCISALCQPQINKSSPNNYFPVPPSKKLFKPPPLPPSQYEGTIRRDEDYETFFRIGKRRVSPTVESLTTQLKLMSQ